ncbi:hypothetical protein GCM10011400_29280 [Paraburkholderia caffeinilytica]|uniref:Uncharacterized protein n=1 Tax=Paraburkholderia caffeinilytica TaxID=1761016 RepID=A0ABQ1MH90_9BURK|nr:hypothetical protein GCM10011400_29280 [Paraburkholderia caffeinilytica]
MPNSAALVIFMSRLLNDDGKSESVRMRSTADSNLNMGLDVTCANRVPVPFPGSGLRCAFLRCGCEAAMTSASWLRNVGTILSKEWVLDQRERQERQERRAPERALTKRISVAAAGRPVTRQ